MDEQSAKPFLVLNTGQAKQCLFPGEVKFELPQFLPSQILYHRFCVRTKQKSHGHSPSTQRKAWNGTRGPGGQEPAVGRTSDSRLPNRLAPGSRARASQSGKRTQLCAPMRGFITAHKRTSTAQGTTNLNTLSCLAGPVRSSISVGGSNTAQLPVSETRTDGTK